MNTLRQAVKKYRAVYRYLRVGMRRRTAMFKAYQIVFQCRLVETTPGKWN